MLCFLPPVAPAPRRQPGAPRKGGGATVTVLVVLTALAALFTPIGWVHSQPVYTVHMGVATQLVPLAVERELLARLDRATAPQTIPRKPPSFFARQGAYHAIPPGLTLDAATGALVGTPFMTGSYTVALGISNGASTSVLGPSFKVRVLPPL